MNRNSLKQQLVESPVTYGFTLHEFGGVLGDGLGTLSFGPSQICGRGHGSWLMCKVALNNHGVQCSRLKSSIPFKRNSALQNTPLKITLQNAIPNSKSRCDLKSSIEYACHKNQQAKGICHYKKQSWMVDS